MSDNIYSCPKCGSEGEPGEIKEVPHTYGSEHDVEFTCIECNTKWKVRDGIETYRIDE